MRGTACLALFLSAAGGAGVGAQQQWGPGESDICISEIHFHPPDKEGSHEFVQLHNRGAFWVDLGGWAFTSGLEFAIPEGTFLGPGAYLAIARDAKTLREEAGDIQVLGDF